MADEETQRLLHRRTRTNARERLWVAAVTGDRSAVKIWLGRLAGRLGAEDVKPGATLREIELALVGCVLGRKCVLLARHFHGTGELQAELLRTWAAA